MFNMKHTIAQLILITEEPTRCHAPNYMPDGLLLLIRHELGWLGKAES